VKLDEEFSLLIARDIADQRMESGKVDEQQAIETAKMFLLKIYEERIENLRFR
jgi:hypothetical protein